MKMRLDPKIETALNETGKEWSITCGKRHYHIKIDNNLIGILPKGSGSPDPRAVKNCISQIRKAAKGIPWSRHHV